MAQETIKIFVTQFIPNHQKKNYPTNKTDVYHIDDIWSLDILHLRDYGPENNGGYRYVVVIIENFNKFGCTAPLKVKNAKSIGESFENILISSKKNQF